MRFTKGNSENPKLETEALIASSIIRPDQIARLKQDAAKHGDIFSIVKKYQAEARFELTTY